MTLAVSNRTILRSAIEATFGSVAAGTARRKMRFTGETFDYKLQFDASKEIRSDRQIADQILLAASAQGGVNFEGIYQEYDAFYEDALQSTFSSFAGATGVSPALVSPTFAASTLTQTGGTSFAAIPKGAWVSIAGCTGTFLPNNGAYETSRTVAASATVLTFEGTPFSQTGAATGSVVVSHSRLVNGVASRSRNFEVEFNDLTKFLTFVGMQCSKLSLNAQQAAVLTGSFEYMGAQALPLAGASQLVGTDDVKFPTAWDVMNATSNVAKLYVGGVPLSGTFAKTLSLDVDNSLRAQTAIGNLAPIGCGSGTLKVTGKLSAYFANSTLYDMFTGNTASSIALVVKDAAGNGYGYKVPAIEITGATITSGSLDTDLMVDIEWAAKIDNADTGKMIVIDRFGAAV